MPALLSRCTKWHSWALQTALFLSPGNFMTAQAYYSRHASFWGGLTAAIALSLRCLHCVLLVCRLPLLDEGAARDSDSDEEDEEELPAYEYRFETAKLLLEVDDTVETTLKVRSKNNVDSEPSRETCGLRVCCLCRLHGGHSLF